MDSWEDLPPLLLKISAIVLALLAVLDLARIGFVLILASIFGELVPLIPGIIGRILSGLVTLTTFLLALALVLGIASILVAVFLFRFARRVEEGLATESERTLWIAILLVTLALSVLAARWYYVAAAAVGLLGVLLSRTF